MVTGHQIEDTLKAAGKSHLFTRLSYPNAGHIIEPPYTPNSRVSLWSTKPKKCEPIPERNFSSSQILVYTCNHYILMWGSLLYWICTTVQSNTFRCAVVFYLPCSTCCVWRSSCTTCCCSGRCLEESPGFYGEASEMVNLKILRKKTPWNASKCVVFRWKVLLEQMCNNNS